VALTIDHISKSYGSLRALTDISFEVADGEIFGFVGSNGAGKTTTMRIALGVLAADSGNVSIDGHPVDLETRKRIGYMPEERGLYPKMKVGEQLSYLARLHGLSKSAADSAVTRWTSRLGVDGRLGDTVSQLSLGNQQRVQLAAALVHDPAVLVLDEPFSGLDPVAVDVMSEVLREKAAEGVPVLFSSHQLALVESLCDRVGIIVNGSMRALGSVGQLQERANAHLHVVAPQAPAGWAGDLPNTVVVQQDGDRTILELLPGADDQLILRTALATGPVREFATRRPSLTELYREVVA
jgi:ABC-2 type transport system ATP-binding protein